ncbi:MAG: hypothetical protein HYX27_10070 [Acidobacteria bacterium]|nr:hypothetical protein [Acidobacteriota bacterium]
MPVDIQILQSGDSSRPRPYSILFAANPVLKQASGALIIDPVMTQQAAFNTCVRYAIDCLFGRLPAQAENFLADPAIGPRIRLISVFETGLPVSDPNSLVEERVFGGLVAPRRGRYAPYLARHGILADVAYAISASDDFRRASAYGTTDDTGRPGTPFRLDGQSLMHWHFPDISGTVAMHLTARSLTPAHEFGHAASSYNSGFVTDLYIPNTSPNFNVRIGRPIVNPFATYNGTPFAPDPTRDGLGYGAWNSYHPALVNATVPALMDNYTTQVNPLVCRHDTITRAFLRDRLIAKLGR